VIGIQEVAYYIPTSKTNNYERLGKFNLDDSFLESKLGIKSVAIAPESETTESLCLKAYENLIKQADLTVEKIEAIIVVSQTPGESIPHLSAKLHGQIGAAQNCACFDISLGCSGYVYGLSVVKAFMEAQGMSYGLLFTCDPYSKIIDYEDKNTSLLFGDAASVTLLSETPMLAIGKVSANTLGKGAGNLQTKSGKLTMNGRAVYSFCVQKVPEDIKSVIANNNLSLDDIDLFLVHQGSKFIVDSIRGRLSLPEHKMPFFAQDYGNTVSSSIPIALADNLRKSDIINYLISGFGVGLSWGSTVLRRL
jgi:3-oxoacyl-[acyl-carrier-protein] synthase-3